MNHGTDAQQEVTALVGKAIQESNKDCHVRYEIEDNNITVSGGWVEFGENQYEVKGELDVMVAVNPGGGVESFHLRTYGQKGVDVGFAIARAVNTAPVLD